jgi:hypothetical protein
MNAESNTEMMNNNTEVDNTEVNNTEVDNTEVDNSVTMGGGLDEAGWMDSIGGGAYKDENCFAELFDNSHDWGAKHIKIDETTENLLIGDDGVGMSKKGLIDMYIAYKPPKACFRTGVRAIGSKAGQAGLSRMNNNKVISTTDGKVYNTAEPNWKKMVEENKYTNNIPIRCSTPEEIQLFRNVIGATSGTLFVFPKSKQLTELIHSQFGTNAEPGDIDPKKLWSVIYGRIPDLDIHYRPHKDIEYKLKLYNPMASLDIIGTKNETDIYFYKNPKTEHTRFIIKKIDKETNTLTEYEFSSTLKSCHTELEPVKESKQDYKYEGLFHFACFLPKLNIPFSEITGAKAWSLYDREILGNRITDKNMKKYNEKLRVIRNDINIGVSDMQRSDARGNCYSNMNTMIHCELSYKPLSVKDEPRDKLVNIYGNKHEPVIEFPKQLQRLLGGLLKEKTNELKEMHKNLELSEIVITPKSKKEKKAKKDKKDKKDETTNADGNDDDNSSINSTSTSSSNSNVKVGGGGSAVDQADDNNDATGGGGAASTGKPSKPIDVPSHRKGLVMGSELQEKLGLLVLRLNAEQGYDDADYIALFNILQKIENKE